MSKQTERSLSYLTFQMGDEVFAANVSKVLEILEIPPITKVPQAPSFMRGVINLRGTVLPVIDTRAKFGLPAVPDTIDTCIIVLNIEKQHETIAIGAIVDAVQEVTEIDDTTIQPVPGIGIKYKTEFITGMVKLNDRFIILLNIDKVFTSEEAAILQDISAETV
jgi:purine-binding chemotaxis protein CheW